MEVGQADDRDRRDAGAVLDHVEEDAALAVLGLGHAEEVRQRWSEVDRARGDGGLADARAAGQEGGPHVHVGRQILDTRQVAVLAKEVRRRNERARRLRVELVRRIGEDDEIARSSGMGHVCGLAVTDRDAARLGLGEDLVDHLPAFGLAVVRPVVGIGQAEEPVFRAPR